MNDRYQIRKWWFASDGYNEKGKPRWTEPALSGEVFTTRQEAETALKKLRLSFPRVAENVTIEEAV